MAARISRSDIVRALARVEMFARLGAPVVERLADVAVPRTYPKGSLLFTEGDPGGSLIVLMSGAVTIFRTSQHGDRAVLNVMRPPEVLGELALIDGAPRSAGAEALTSTTVLSVSRESFLGLMHSQPVLLDLLLRHLGAMIRRLTDQTADHVFLDLAGRVAKALVRLSDSTPAAPLMPPRPGTGTAGTPGGATGRAAAPAGHPGAPAVATVPAVVDVTQGRLAEMAGGSRQSVNQVLGTFASRGILRMDGRKIVITDVEALRRRAGMAPTAPAPAGPAPGLGARGR